MSFKESMYRISWITPTSFVDVDLPVISELQKRAKIYWQVIVFGKVNDDLKSLIESQLHTTENVKCDYVEIPYRVFDPRTLSFYCNVLKRAKSYNPDLLYTSLDTAPFGPLVYKLYFPIEKCIIACHNVTTPKGANREHYSRFYINWNLRAFTNIQVFSESQYDVLNRIYHKKKVLLAPLAIKDYGEPSIEKSGFDNNHIVFLFFGIISPYKRLDLLIQAAQNLYNKGYQNFKVKIAGSCKSWSEYESMITIPELFDTRIERIPNNEVADLFAQSDYFVMPYQDIAQSGAITVAYRYNLPIILSDLPQFKPYGINGRTCLFFESNNVGDLEEKMIKAIEGGKLLYDELSKGLASFVQERYSTPVIAKKYLDFFDGLIKQGSDA